MIKNLHCCFCIKTQYFFILDYKGIEKEMGVGGWRIGERGLSNYNQRKIIEISKYEGNVALGTFSYNK